LSWTGLVERLPRAAACLDPSSKVVRPGTSHLVRCLAPQIGGIESPQSRPCYVDRRLEAAKLHYALGHFRDSISVLVSVPGARWEVEFFEDGQVEVEIFAPKGMKPAPDSVLERLFEANSN
jgi:hypothetical protein